MTAITAAPRRRRRPALGVDVNAAADLVGGVLKWVGLAFLAPAVMAAATGEPVWPFLAGGGAASGAGLALDRLTDDREAGRLGPREGFLVVALVWLLVPVFGAIPFLLGGGPQLSNPINAFFESMSGFTATGGTVLTDIDAVPHAILFWRQLSHWLGGMGIIVLAVAVLPRLRVGGRRLLQSELAGPAEIERLSSTIRDTARRLWKLYVGMTAVATLVLAAFGWLGIDPAMSLFRAFSYASSAIALGGFAPRGDSVAGFQPATQWFLCAVMAIAGVNFLRLFRLLVQREVRVVAHDEELRLYFAFLAIASALLMLELFAGGHVTGEAGVRAATFQAVSIMTTTGFATADYTHWGPLAAMTLLLLMFIGASAGSTGGSIKVVRHLMLIKIVRRELAQAAHRDVVVPVRVSGVAVEERALRSAIVFVVLYFFTFAIGSLCLLIDARRVGADLGAFEAIGAAASCIANVGPAFGAAGPFGSYAGFSDLSTAVLSVLMWLGRIEIIPVVILLTRAFWRP